MLKRKLVFLVVGCLLITLSGCSRIGNRERAYFSQQGSSYLVELKGTRRLMAHDPISFILGRTYEETLVMELPRIEGEIEGYEIPVPPDKLPYGGRVVIAKDKLKIDLFYDDPSDTKVPLPWNGQYTLVPRITKSDP